jgi:hypothetical protein
MQKLIDRLKEPSSWAAIGAACLGVAALFPLPGLLQTALIVAGLAGLAFGLGLPERLRR